jgi:hypothetical protein
LPKAAAGRATRNCDDSCKSRWDQLLARDLTLLKSPEYEHLPKEVTEVKQMLAVLIRKLIADR